MLGGTATGSCENASARAARGAAACWAVMACAMLGNAERAWQALDTLLPANHADTEEGALHYRVEPYVMAGDVYGEAPFAGRGGWTWYTGAAGWLCRAAIKYLLGYERQGNGAKLNALLRPGQDEAALTVRVGATRYRLRSLKGHDGVTLDGRAVDGDFIDLVDDGGFHEALFPERPPYTADSASGEGSDAIPEPPEMDRIPALP